MFDLDITDTRQRWTGVSTRKEDCGKLFILLNSNVDFVSMMRPSQLNWNSDVFIKSKD